MNQHVCKSQQRTWMCIPFGKWFTIHVKPIFHPIYNREYSIYIYTHTHVYIHLTWPFKKHGSCRCSPGQVRSVREAFTARRRVGTLGLEATVPDMTWVCLQNMLALKVPLVWNIIVWGMCSLFAMGVS